MINTRAAVAMCGLVGGLSVSVPPSSLGETLAVRVITVRASDVGPCDERLADLRPRLRKVSGFRGFEMVDDVSRSIAIRTEAVIALPGGRQLLLLPKRSEGDLVQMQMRLSAGRRRLVETNLEMRNGGTMVFGLGPERRPGEEVTLIVLKAEEIR